MKIIDIRYVDDSVFMNKSVKNNVLFLNSDDCKFIYEASNGNIDVIKNWFNIIGVCYDDVYFIGKLLVYKVDDVVLALPDLSSGERFILYLLACKYVNKEVIVVSLFERLGSRLERVVYNEFKDYDLLTVIIYSFIISPDFKYLCVKDM